ncbi:hypothetical protein [Qipengyuania qiaonensis]|uniref:YtxH domain-containing protein n=1 Tax=Qipengyuania qiaonensis TaxID=2867240 RepID=A0ABS7J5U3_9SPHN|nr:hypothetical protein [Qipengyuania qiaonensis]MBX7482646.1 hypothetical protein [Qipengyuania qiaonensis]
MEDKSLGGEAYHYGRTQAGGVFALAGLAAGGAVALVWGAWATLEDATHDNSIAQPPDLKAFVQQVEGKAEQIARRATRESRAEAKSAE